MQPLTNPRTGDRYEPKDGVAFLNALHSLMQGDYLFATEAQLFALQTLCRDRGGGRPLLNENRNVLLGQAREGEPGGALGQPECGDGAAALQDP